MALLNTIVLFYISFNQPCSLQISEGRKDRHCFHQDNIQIIILAWEFVMRSCLKPQNPCSNHEIHVLFEHGFYLKKPKLGPDLHA